VRRWQRSILLVKGDHCVGDCICICVLRISVKIDHYITVRKKRISYREEIRNIENRIGHGYAI